MATDEGVRIGSVVAHCHGLDRMVRVWSDALARPQMDGTALSYELGTNVVVARF